MTQMIKEVKYQHACGTIFNAAATREVFHLRAHVMGHHARMRAARVKFSCYT